MKRIHYTTPILVASMTCAVFLASSQATAQIPDFSQLTDRFQGAVDQPLNRVQQGQYFNDAVWNQAQPLFRQFEVGPVRVQASVDPYGYVQNTPEDDWFYDRYNYQHQVYYPPAGSSHNHSVQYYDSDGDGIYDRYDRVYDQDGDGYYEQVDHYTFAAPQPDQRVQGQPSQSADEFVDSPFSASQLSRVKGDIIAMKTAKVDGTEHALFRIRMAQTDDTIPVDAGPLADLGFKPELGQEISAIGRIVKMGKQRLFVATKIETDNQTVEINHQPDPLVGTVVETKTIEVRGTPNRWVVMKDDQGRHQVIDLGPTKEIDVELRPESQIRVYGAPVKMMNNSVVMAQKFEYGDRFFHIQRPISAQGR